MTTRRFEDISEAERFVDDDFGAGFDADDDFALPAQPAAAPSAFGTSAFPADDGFDPPAGAPAPPAGNPVAALQASAEAAFGETSVPRITIHAFCQHAETADAVEKAAGDRRLSRATTLVHEGGLDEALARYQNEPTPSLIMVEANSPAAQLLAGLDRLAEVCDPGTKVVVIGGHNDIGLYRELIRRGVSEYLVPPLQPLQLIRTITGLYADPSTPFIGRTLAFVGAKGGVGSSTIAHNVAYTLAEVLQANTTIVDFDLAFGTAGLDFNQDPIQGMADALSKPDRLDPVLLDRMIARCTDRLSLFSAPASLDDDYEYSAEAYEDVATKIRATAPFVVYDLPHVWSGWMRKTLLSADEVVIVAAPDLASLRNAKNMIDLLARTRPNDAPPRLILNQIGLPGRPEIPVKDFAKALGIEPALCLPFDAKLFGQAANNGQMIQEVNPKAKASEGLCQFVQGLARREAPVVKAKSLIDRLLKRS
jgi:pilus assembly protein CpaE